ncbi:MAG: amino acid adenylation domain-containing protein [bacterium]
MTQQEIIEGYRLSPQQKRLWLQQGSGSLPYCWCAVQIDGELDPSLLTRALNYVVSRYEILRTTFQLLPGMTIPVQVIADEAAISVARHNVSGPDADDPAAKITELVEVAISQLDVAQLPVLRIDLMTITSTQHVLILTAPAFCADHRSLQHLVRETFRAYAAFQHGGEPAGVETMQYADFAEWRNELLESAEAAGGRQYWKQHDLSRVLAERMTFENVAADSRFQPESVAVEVSPQTVVRIRKAAEQQSASVAAFLLACWQTVLGRSTGWSDVTIGIAFDGRKFAELENTIGLLSDFVPVCNRVDGEIQLTTLIRQVDERLQEAQRWQEYFSWDQDESFFPFCFELRQRPDKFTQDGLTMSFERTGAFLGRFKLKLVCEESGGAALAVKLQYDASVFASVEARRLARRFETIIADAGARPTAKLADLDLIGEEERKQLLDEFNHTAQDFPIDRIHELFEKQVNERSDSVALVFEDERLTYAALNARANQLAHHLRKLGVGPDVPVGLCLERSLDLIVGLLGILKAGGAYVPLDPGLPKPRIATMLVEAGVRVLVSRSLLAESFYDRLETVVCLDADRPLLERERTDNPRTNGFTQNLAYIIFTSGSTGKPKGVAVEHRQLANYINTIWERLDLPIGSSFASVSTVAADLGNTVIFPPLCKGGTLHLIAEERATNPDDLADYFVRQAIDCLKIVPSHLSALLSASNPAGVLPRRRLVLGGEACPWSLIEKIKSLAPECEILNHYGPTEATVGSTTYRVERTEADGGSDKVPLGRPLENAQTFILDKRGWLAPIGAPGELHIGGAGVARGYINRADATAEKFIPNPFGGDGERLYKTGDLARYFSNGRIEFLGRVDDQVKIHGYRIEPGEIEQVLRDHHSVAASVVIAREDQPGEKRLVAYTVLQNQQKTDANELRVFLGGRLPEYMMPSAFVFLERLPLTPNGKIDRHALPPPDRFRSDGDQFALPRNNVEATLAKIWSGVLGLERIGIHHNFFELGGDSILSIQIIARANQAGLRLSPRQLFQHQTIAELASVAGTINKVEAEQGVVSGIVPLTPVQARFFAQDQAEPHYYNQAMMLSIDEPLDASVLERAFEHLLVHHDALRTRFERTKSGWQQLIAPPDFATDASGLALPNGGDASGSSFEVESFDLSALGDEEQVATMQKLADNLQASLSLENGKLMRMALFKRGAERRSNLLIVIHHLVVDGVSWRVLLEDLQMLYTQLSRKKEIELPAKTTSFKSWSEQLSAHAKSDAMLAEAPYWLSLGERSVTPLPQDFNNGANTAASAQTVTALLNPRETLALLTEAPAAYRTQINEVLLAALAQTLSQWTNSSSVLLDLEGHGREEIFEGVDLSRTVGWFTTIFPVALDLKESQPLIDRLRLVKEQLRAIPNRGIGYGLLRYLSGNEEIVTNLSRQAQADVRFNYLGQVDRALPDSSIFSVAPESSGRSQSPKGARAYLLNIIGIVSGGELRLEWTYSENIHRRETVESLAESYMKELRVLIAQARTGDSASLLPSDFPRAKLSQADLHKVLSKIKESRTRN